MSVPLLLDEIFSDAIARQLRAKHHDVAAVVADLALAGLPDDQILAHAAAQGRALVTANIRDFMPLNSQYATSGTSHAGLILVSAKTFPSGGRLRRRHHVGARNAARRSCEDPAGPGPVPGEQLATVPHHR